jgi:nucleoside-diphosphate-sugar epimerase
MAAKRNVITGATGFLGSYVAEQLVERGEYVRALVRPTSNTAILRTLGVELVEGDLGKPNTLPRAVEGADIVYHCAARVGDWGPWSAFKSETLDATANLLGACQNAGVGRVLHVSSINVYGHPRERPDPFTEVEPLGQNPWLWDYYCRAKVEAEKLCQAYRGAVTIVRPSWMFGPRDRNTFGRVLTALFKRRVPIVGAGDNRLNVIYVSDVADGVIRAATHPAAVGRAYNLSSPGEISQRDFLDHLTAQLGLPRIRRHVPYRLAHWGAFLSETIARMIRLRRPPHITRYAVALIGRSVRFSIERARLELGWEPRVPVLEGVRRTLEWHFAGGSGIATPRTAAAIQ